MALTKLTKPRARWATFKLKVAAAIERSLYDKVAELGSSVKDFGATGNGTTNDTASFAHSSTLPKGTYLVDDDTVIAGKDGLGSVKKSSGNYPVNPFPVPLKLETISDGLITTINPRGWDTDGTYAYCVTQGSYNGTDQSTFEVFDISDRYNIKSLSVSTVGVLGEGARALSLYGQYVYCQSFNGYLTIFDVSNPTNPTKVVDRLLMEASGNREQSLIAGTLLITPLMSGGLLFHSLSDPTNPVLIKRFAEMGIAHKPVLDGNKVWIPVATPNSSSEASLLCIDITNPRDPVLLSSSILPTLVECRTGSIQGKYLYLGGFNEANSRLNVIDISDAANPSVVYTHPTAVGKECLAMGNLLFVDNELFDITDPELPLSTGVVSDAPHDQIQKPLLIGNTLFGLTLGTGDKGAHAGDSYADPTLRAIRVSDIDVVGADFGSIRTELMAARKAKVKEELSVGSLVAGAAGVSTTGSMSGKRVISHGVIEKGNYSAIGSKLVSGDISTNTDIFALSGLNRHFTCRLTYTLIANASGASGADHTMGTKIFSFYVSSDGTVYPRIPVTDMVTEVSIGILSSLTVTLTNGTATSPVLVGVTSPELGSVGYPRSHFELDVQCSDFDFKLENL